MIAICYWKPRLGLEKVWFASLNLFILVIADLVDVSSGLLVKHGIFHPEMDKMDGISIGSLFHWKKKSYIGHSVKFLKGNHTTFSHINQDSFQPNHGTICDVDPMMLPWPPNSMA